MTPPTKEIQGDPFVTDDLTPYMGSWVTLRNGKVVASALDPVELRDHADVRSDDDLVLVPTEFASTLVL